LAADGRRQPQTTDSFLKEKGLGGSAIADKLFHGQPNVPCYLPQQYGGDVSVRVERQGRETPIRMAKLFVRSSLPNFFKAEPAQY
jgi:hypothetical protein